jgi:transposase
MMSEDGLQSGHKPRTNSFELIEAKVSTLEASPDVPRRRWSKAAKERIVAEALEPDANISEIARRHDLRPQQIFTWRREAVRAAQIEPLGDSPGPAGTDRPRQNVIEIVLGDLVIFVGNDVPTARLVEIVLAMRSA